jgi:hypothetical protein
MADEPTAPRSKIRILLIRIGIILALILAVLAGVNQAMLPPGS